MNPKQMLTQLLSALEQVMSSDETLSDELQGEIAKTLGALYERIQSEGQEITTPPDQIPAGADLLWVLSGGDIDAFVSYLRTFPGPGLLDLSNDANRLNSVIKHFQINKPIGEKGMGPDGIQDTQVQSSNVVGFRYEPKTQNLLVKFHGEPIEPVYKYDNVPPIIAQLILKGAATAKTSGKNKWGRWWIFKRPSLGSSVNTYLKSGGYAYQRLR